MSKLWPTIDVQSNIFKVHALPSLQNTHYTIILTPDEMRNDIEQVMGEAFDTVIPILNNFIEHDKPFKMDFQVLATFYKLSDPEITCNPLFKKGKGEPSEMCQTYQDIYDKLERDITKFKTWVEMFNEYASNWILQSIDQIKFICSEINLVRGGAGKVVLPPVIARSRCIINFEVLDSQDCFIYAILIALHHKEFENPARIIQYRQYMKDFDLSTITPSKYKNLKRRIQTLEFLHMNTQTKAQAP